MLSRKNIYLLIDSERHRQLKLHGDKTPSNPAMSGEYKLMLMMEEVGECARAIQSGDNANLRDELIQVVALGVAYLESMGI